jgi:uroporphyrinogen-III synthase
MQDRRKTRDRIAQPRRNGGETTPDDAVGVAALPLAGFTVGVTADRRAEEQIELLRRRGASIVHGPVIKTLPLVSDRALRDVTDELHRHPPDYLIANTGIGMRSWFAAAESWGSGDALVDTLARATVFARGPKAASASHTAGLDVAWRAPSERLDEVIQLLLAEPIDGARVAYQEHGDDAAGALEQLRDAGADVVRVPVYRWILPDDDALAQRLVEAVVNGRVHAVTYTSAPAVRNSLAIADRMGRGREFRHALSSRVSVACVGPVCAEQAVEDGITDPIVPSKARLGLLVRALCDRLADDALEMCVQGHAVRIQGSAVLVDGEQVDLPEREAQVLRLLAEKPGSVVGKQHLLREVWNGNADPHVVEVTIGRLRRRVGVFAPALRVIPRRGYVLACDP